MIRRVHLCSNGMVRVFNDRDLQMPEYQGNIAREMPRIFEDAPDDALFYIGKYGGKRQVKISRWTAGIVYQISKYY